MTNCMGDRKQVILSFDEIGMDSSRVFNSVHLPMLVLPCDLMYAQRRLPSESESSKQQSSSALENIEYNQTLRISRTCLCVLYHFM